MKTKITLVILLLLSSCCNNEKKQIEQAAYGYLDAMGNYRIDDARPYSTPQTCSVTLDFLCKIMPSVDTAYISSNTPAEITIKSVQQTSDTTAYVLFHKSTPITQQDDTLQMVKMDGRWLAHVIINVPPLINATLDGGDNTITHRRRFTREEARQLRPVLSDSVRR